jgi:hypothetical protein
MKYRLKDLTFGDHSKFMEFIDNELEQLSNKIDEKRNEFVWDDKNPNLMKDFQKVASKQVKKYSKLSNLKRLHKKPTYDELPDYGDVMSLEEFVECCNCGGFIDYDGSGNYVKDGKISDISIYPSDVTKYKIREDFDTIIWFNK